MSVLTFPPGRLPSSSQEPSDLLRIAPLNDDDAARLQIDLKPLLGRKWKGQRARQEERENPGSFGWIHQFLVDQTASLSEMSRSHPW